MKKNEDGTFTMNFNEARGSSIRCEEPGYVLNQYEFHILSHNDSSTAAKYGDLFLKMLLGFLLQIVVSIFLVFWKNDDSYNRIDLFQLVSIIICLLVYLSCVAYIKFRGTTRTHIINNIAKTFR